MRGISLKPIPIFFLLFISLSISAQEIPLQYDVYTINEGLSQNKIYCISQDNFGFMWFGTQDGLNRFDGRNFKVFRDSDDPTDNKCIKGNMVYCFYMNPENNCFYIGTDKALNKYDFITETFSATNLHVNKISCIDRDKYKRIWIGTEQGLFVLTDDSLKVIRFNEDSLEIHTLKAVDDTLWIGTHKGLFVRNIKSISDSKLYSKVYFTNRCDEDINTLFFDNKDTLWIGTEKGTQLYAYTKNNNLFHNFDLYKKANTAYNPPIKTILKGQDGKIWFGSINDNRYDLEKEDSFINDNLSDINILSLYFDKKNVFWVGTNTGGVNKLNSSTQIFKLYKNGAENNKSNLSDNYIRSINKLNDSEVICATGDGKLNLFNIKSKEISLLYTREKGLSNIFVDSMTNHIWAGSSSGNVFCYDSKFKRIDSIKIGTKYIRFTKIVKNHPNLLWVGTEDGLLIFDFITRKFILNSESNNKYFIPVNIFSILPDQYNNCVWAGSLGHGLYIVNTDNNIVTLTRNLKNKSDTILSNSEVIVIIQDEYRTNVLWLGTEHGLFRFDKEKQSVTEHYLHHESDNTIVGIIQEKNNTLWLSTNKGRLIKFNTEKNRIEGLFDRRDGLQDGEFVGNAFYKSNMNGVLFFGGTHGLNSFNPDSIKIDTNLPSIYFTKLIINSKEVHSGDTIDGYIYTKSILFDSIIRLDYEATRTIKIEFAALDFAVPNRIHYWCELIHDDDTTRYDLGGNNFITLSGLRWGKYKLNIWSGNSYISNQENRSNLRTIFIEIKTPFGETTYAYVLKIGFIILIVSVFVLLYIVSLKNKKNKNLSAILKKRNEILEGINRLMGIIKPKSEHENIVIDKEEELKNRMRWIAAEAIDLLSIDVVSLFWYTNNKDNVYEKDFIIEGDLLHPEVRNQKQLKLPKTKLIDIIIPRRKEFLWINNRTEYLELVEKQLENIRSEPQKFTERFYFREKIISFVAINLWNNEDKIGVLFFNFRRPFLQTNENEYLIRMYAKFAEHHIKLSKLVDYLQLQSESMHHKAKLKTAEQYYHEMANYITNINSRKNLLKSAIDDGNIPNAKRNFDLLDKACENGREVFLFLRSFLSGSICKIDNTNIRESIEMAMSQFIDIYENINYIYKIDSKVSIKGYKGGLIIIIKNLADNAIRSIANKGVVEISCNIDDDFIYIIIKDNGSGMDKKTLKKVFNTNFSTKKPEENGGYGLILINDIVKFWGGTITCQSELGNGTEFRISLPKEIKPMSDYSA